MNGYGLYSSPLRLILLWSCTNVHVYVHAILTYTLLGSNNDFYGIYMIKLY